MTTTSWHIGTFMVSALGGYFADKIVDTLPSMCITIGISLPLSYNTYKNKCDVHGIYCNPLTYITPGLITGIIISNVIKNNNNNNNYEYQPLNTSSGDDMDRIAASLCDCDDVTCDLLEEYKKEKNTTSSIHKTFQKNNRVAIYKIIVSNLPNVIILGGVVFIGYNLNKYLPKFVGVFEENNKNLISMDKKLDNMSKTMVEVKDTVHKIWARIW